MKNKVGNEIKVTQWSKPRVLKAGLENPLVIAAIEKIDREAELYYQKKDPATPLARIGGSTRAWTMQIQFPPNHKDTNADWLIQCHVGVQDGQATVVSITAYAGYRANESYGTIVVGE